MANTIQPTQTDEQTERLLQVEWTELLLKLSDKEAEAAQRSLDENLDGLNDLPVQSLARYRIAIYAACIEYYLKVLVEGYVPYRERML